MMDAAATIATRASRSEPMAVLVADLDHFKTINDVHGHAVGDRVLKVFATVLDRCVGISDLSGRLGGEEFAILLPGKGEAAARELAERIRRAFAEAAGEVEGPRSRRRSASGVAASRIGVHDLEGLIGQADRALYQAKEAGRNRVGRLCMRARALTRRPAPRVAFAA